MKRKEMFVWGARIVVALIYFQSLFFKFSGAAESVTLFTMLGVEPWGRILLGIIELGIVITILIPRTYYYAAFASLIVMIGAILSHLLVIGISFNGDGGVLFLMALLVFVLSAYLFKVGCQK